MNATVMSTSDRMLLACDLLTSLERRGITLWVEASAARADIWCQPAQRLTLDDRRAIVRHRGDLVSVLRALDIPLTVEGVH